MTQSDQWELRYRRFKILKRNEVMSTFRSNLGCKTGISQSSWIVLSLSAFDRALSDDHYHTVGDSIRPVEAEIQAF